MINAASIAQAKTSTMLSPCVLEELQNEETSDLETLVKTNPIMDIVENRALKIRTRLADKILEEIPRSKLLGKVPNTDVDEVLIYWGTDEVRALHKLGFKKTPPAPLHKYEWTGIYKPMAHQKTTAEFLTTHDKCFLLSEQGTGKTCSAAWAADYLMKRGLVKRVLVVCPISIMHAAWKEDLFRSVMHRRIGIAHGTKLQRSKVIKSEAEFVIINYDGIEVVIDDIMAGGFDLIIVDEANNLKTTTTRRWKAFHKVLNASNARLWMMTGTPAAQSPEDAYGLAKLVCPDRVPKYYTQWRDLVMQKITMYKWVPRPRSRDIVFNALQPAIRFTKEQCLDLPDIMYVRRDVELTPQQLHYYKAMKAQMMLMAAGEEVSSVNAAAKINKLLQISCGAVYADSGEVLRFDASNRLAVMDEIIDESPKKSIIFAPYRHTIELIKDHLETRGLQTTFIHGDVSPTKRGEIIKDFQENPDTKVIVIQPQAASHGITLTAASSVIWFGPTSSVETYLQANARAHRNGQDTKVTVFMLQGSPAEERMYTMLDKRVDSHESLISLYEDIMKD
jgi:SNF2 family DNA or RNA helicase